MKFIWDPTIIAISLSLFQLAGRAWPLMWRAFCQPKQCDAMSNKVHCSNAEDCVWFAYDYRVSAFLELFPHASNAISPDMS